MSQAERNRKAGSRCKMRKVATTTTLMMTVLASLSSFLSNLVRLVFTWAHFSDLTREYHDARDSRRTVILNNKMHAQGRTHIHGGTLNYIWGIFKRSQGTRTVRVESRPPLLSSTKNATQVSAKGMYLGRPASSLDDVENVKPEQPAKKSRKLSTKSKKKDVGSCSLTKKEIGDNVKSALRLEKYSISKMHFEPDKDLTVMQMQMDMQFFRHFFVDNENLTQPLTFMPSEFNEDTAIVVVEMDRLQAGELLGVSKTLRYLSPKRGKNDSVYQSRGKRWVVRSWSKDNAPEMIETLGKDFEEMQLDEAYGKEECCVSFAESLGYWRLTGKTLKDVDHLIGVTNFIKWTTTSKINSAPVQHAEIRLAKLKFLDLIFIFSTRLGSSYPLNSNIYVSVNTCCLLSRYRRGLISRLQIAKQSADCWTDSSATTRLRRMYLGIPNILHFIKTCGHDTSTGVERAHQPYANSPGTAQYLLETYSFIASLAIANLGTSLVAGLKKNSTRSKSCMPVALTPRPLLNSFIVRLRHDGLLDAQAATTLPTSRRRLWTSEEDLLLKTLRGKGETYRAMGNALERSASAVNGRLTKLGLTTPVKKTRRRVYRKRSQAEYERALELRAAGRTTAEISRILDLNYQTVYQWLQERTHVRLSIEEAGKIRDMRNRGANIARICAALPNHPFNTIQTYVKKLLRAGLVARRIKPWSDEEIQKLEQLRKDGASVEKMVDQLPGRSTRARPSMLF
ncbi:uncharacterized protein MYCFIDRAFT_176135 [Pseudocercospora fijiensis CIRAD86]|uniref:Uncharacterized protein n=1 Tax=Pseudocercospora fijiensis (strain CIRAD86) TaxID=383855 RepID=M3A835_PSEFD|nr:uncharacterized protein MYCFIDRAFT_176135 [Pseudocercospora fijiensis CIRAD86]EME80751.1 hypothetical protein MYCFIDRAFT_176135 [Pseudocercospora fijiensis CIRAD86]